MKLDPETREKAAEAGRRAHYPSTALAWATVSDLDRAEWISVAGTVAALPDDDYPTYHDGYTTGRRDEAQAARALAETPTPADDLTRAVLGEYPHPIDPADVRVGDRVRAVTTWDGVITEAGDPDALYMRQDDGGYAFIGPRDDETVLYLLDRRGVDAELIEAMAERAARADDDLYDGEWPAGFPGADAYRTIARAALAALRETHTIEPRPTGGDIRA